MISESVMRLKTARNDRDFVNFQKRRYEELVQETQARYEEARERKDLDLEDHVRELTAK